MLDLSKILSPEKILSAWGINPQDAIAQIVHYKGEFEMMKTGLQEVVTNFNTRLATLEKGVADIAANQSALLNLLQQVLETRTVPPTAEHEQGGTLILPLMKPPATNGTHHEIVTVEIAATDGTV